MALLPGVGALPGVAVAHTRVAQGLQPPPKAHASGVGGGVEVAGQYHVGCVPLARNFLDVAGGLRGLQNAHPSSIVLVNLGGIGSGEEVDDPVGEYPEAILVVAKLV